jgi:2-oxoglutarate dehydrogenase E1 component
MDRFSYLSNADVAAIDQLYQAYVADPASVDTQWARFFEGFDFARTSYPLHPNGSNGAATTPTGSVDARQVSKEIGVLNLIAAYRSRGHLFAQINPILTRPDYKPDLNLEQFGLGEADLDTAFQAGAELGLGAAGSRVTLRQIIEHLKQTYCGPIGVEYLYIRNPPIIKWLQARMEPTRFTAEFKPEEKKQILRKLGQASTFEGFIHRKFVGQKRFSLEGAESIIPALDGVIRAGAELGIAEFVIGMAHRGRLNVLTNIMQKEYDQVFGEFEGKGLADSVFDGDVKYHMGYSSDVVTPTGKNVHLSLAPNPSHLETVDPVVVGTARAKMDNLYGGDNNKICPILIHGDASIAGQGVVYELIQMSRLKGYEVGGSVHIVINNQVGFTTSQSDARSSTYCTDVGKVTLSPVFHVNGDDPEALTMVTQLAIAFRQEFKRDVFIDIICYRKYGHNEGDEPRFTQPLMYEAIGKHPSPFQVYSDKLLKEGAITREEFSKLEKELADNLDLELEQARERTAGALSTKLTRSWEQLGFYDDVNLEPNPDTAVAVDMLKLIAEKVSTLPTDFNAHRNIVKLLETRREMVLTTDKVDWGMGEHLAYGSLLLGGNNVRISGQDVERGTFSHRHAVVTDQKTDAKYVPLNNLREKQNTLYIYNSLLSEYAVMGFDFGYASAAPGTLTIWEAQFGDFMNGAQIIIDQFLTASKTKWQRMNGLVLLLPHGYEGQGPEHSSARMERFLTLCAQNNMYVCDFTTPANLFHALRRQVLTPFRRPLVVFTPKSLLRHPRAVSSVADFAQGGFKEVIDDARVKPAQVKRVVLCTGKLYYDLVEQQEGLDKNDIALVRLEQMYPFPKDQLLALVKRYPKAKEWVWAQEEPENMGAWSFVMRKLREVEVLRDIQVVARRESSSPATGSGSQHASQQQYIIKKALDIAPDTELVKATV